MPRQSGEEMIRFAVVACSLGVALVASSAKGVCAILLGDEPESLLRHLRKRFPNATLIAADNDLAPLVSRIVDFIDAPKASLDIALDLRGTDFQRRVWQALRAIPCGATASYADIARRIGAPKAVRAVAGACAANPIAVAIPCHRVLRANGALSGYRGGVERKRALLARESLKS